MTSGLVVMAYGTPGVAGRHRGLLHPHPPGSPAVPRAAGGPDSPLRGHWWHLPVGGAHPGPGGRDRRGAGRRRARGVAGGAGQQARGAVPRGRAGRPGGCGRGARRGPGAGAALLAGRRSASITPGRRGAAEARAWATPASTAGTTSRRGSTPRPSGCRRRWPTLPERTTVLFTAHSLPERVLEGDPYPDELHASAAAIARQARTWATGGRWPGSRRAARPTVARPRHPRRHPRAGGRGRGGGRAGVPAGLRVGPPGGAVRPRRGCSPGGGRDGPGLRPHRVDQRRAGGAQRPGGACGGRRERARRPGGCRRRDQRAGRGVGGTGEGARVVVLEAGDRPGGKVRTSPLAGVDLDEAADAFLARVPEAVDLCAELGLEAELVSPATGTAYVWWDVALRRLPPSSCWACRSTWTPWRRRACCRRPEWSGSART